MYVTRILHNVLSERFARLIIVQSNIISNELSPEDDDITMHLSDGDSDDKSIKSVATNPTNNQYNSDMRDHMINHASEIKYFKDRYTTPVTIKFSSPLIKTHHNQHRCNTL